jgi:quercetin dioxygenase-like cupin family protein
MGGEVAELSNVKRLQELMAKMPQVQLETRHYFADGMYCREVPRPAGTVIVGKVHKREHFYMVTKGRVAVVVGNESKEYVAPCIIVSKPGTKRAVYAIEDSVCLTVHRTNLVDLDEIEAELLEYDETSLFDARNELKPLAIREMP